MRLPKCGARGTLAVRALPPEPRAAERPLCPHGTHVRNFRSVLEHASIRSSSRDYIYHIFPTGSLVQNFRSVEHASIRSPLRENASILFFGPELERNRINGDQIFCTRDRAWEAYFALFLSTAERRLTADRLTRFPVRVIAHGRHLSLSFYLPPSVGLLLTV